MRNLNLQGLLRSNSIFVFQQSASNPYDRRLFHEFEHALVQQGVYLPQAARAFWGHAATCAPEKSARPGVAGLAYRKKEKSNRDFALVCPLKAELQKSWYVSPGLPFSKNDLMAFTDALFTDFYKLQDFNGLPERFAFKMEGTLAEPVKGPSMTVAGFLAMLDGAHEHHPLLKAATAVLQRDGDRLCPVEGERVKVEAFLREIGHGSLLVCASEDLARDFKPWFDQVWKVTSLSEFAQKLKHNGLLSVFERRRPLTLEDAINVSSQMERIENQMDYERALAIVQRALSCGFSEGLPEKWKRHFYEFENRLLRLTGHTLESADSHADFVIYLNADPTLICKEEQLKAVRGYAASLFDCHKFELGLRVLRPWIDEIEASPSSFHPNSRTFTWNTYSMLGSVRGQLPDWEGYYLKALALQKRWDQTRVHRTLNYMLQSHVRLNQLELAGKVIRQIVEAGAMDAKSSVYFTIYNACYQRALGKTWTAGDSLMENQKDALLKAMYFQATARMKGLGLSERVKRLETAIASLAPSPNQGGRGVRIFLAHCLHLLLATVQGEQTEQRADHLIHFINQPGYETFKTFYSEALREFQTRPGPESAENLITQIPHF